MRVATLIAAAFLLLAGCGSDDESPAPASGGGGGGTTVTMQDNSFDPNKVGGEAGKKVTLTVENKGQAEHTFTIDDQKVDTEVEPGASATVDVTIPESGSVEFYCRFHSGMTGTLGAGDAPAESGGKGSYYSSSADRRVVCAGRATPISCAYRWEASVPKGARLTTRRPRTVIALAVFLLLIVLGLFTVALLRANSNDREDAERRFQDRARVSASLTEAIFSSTSQQAQEQNTQRYGGERVDQQALERAQRQGNLSYVVVLDDRGVPIAFSKNTPPEALERIATKPDDVPQRSPASRSSCRTSSTTSPAAGSWSTRRRSRPRTAVAASSSPVSGAADRPLPRQLPRPDPGCRSRQLVRDRLQAARGRQPGGRPGPGQRGQAPRPRRRARRGHGFGTFDSGGTERAYTSSPVGNSTWRVVLSVRTSQLYSGISTTVQWLILIALAGAGIAAVVLLSRMLSAARAVHGANERLAPRQRRPRRRRTWSSSDPTPSSSSSRRSRRTTSRSRCARSRRSGTSSSGGSATRSRRRPSTTCARCAARPTGCRR